MSFDVQKRVSCTSFEFFKGKKIEWFLIIGVLDITKLSSKC